MNRTIEDSEPYIVCMSTRRNEKELDVIANGEKEVNFLTLEISLEDGVLKENNTIETKNGILEYERDAFETLLNNRNNRKTVKALNRTNKEIEK